MDRFYWNSIRLSKKLEAIEKYKERMQEHKYDGWEGDLERDIEGQKKEALAEYYETLKEIKSVEVAHG